MKLAEETTILVVDDEAGLRKAIAFEFERRGYRVLTAENGLVAQEMLRSNAVDIVISDIRMPGGDGIELLKWIRREQPRMPRVIFITAFSDLLHEDAYDLGAEAIFSKPFDRHGLRQAVQRCLTPRPERWRAEAAPPAGQAAVVPWPNFGSDAAMNPPVASLGTGGMFVAGSGPLPKPETRVRFRLPMQASADAPAALISGEGIVRWIRLNAAAGRPTGCGIEFFSLEDQCRELIARYLEHHAEVTAFIPAA